MKRNLLLFGAPAGVVFFVTVYVLAAYVPGYSHVSETVSEIGEIGSPVAGSFQIAMLAVNLCVVLFAAGRLHFARDNNLSGVAATRRRAIDRCRFLVGRSAGVCLDFSQHQSGLSCSSTAGLAG
jgi:hypothetical protein